MSAWSGILVELAIRGTVGAVLVGIGDAAVGRFFAARHRRIAWMLVAVAFLIPGFWTMPVLPRPALPPPAIDATGETRATGVSITSSGQMTARKPSATSLLLAAWAAGVLVAGAVVVARTMSAAREWSGCRFSTDPDLLDLVEDCRSAAGVGSPVGVIVSERVKAPALLGWIRPRLLLPADLVKKIPRDSMRHILLHELAHHRSADLAWTWIVTAARTLHWFNPAVHFAAHRWQAAREEAADERALQWSGEASGDPYTSTLLSLLKSGCTGRPIGALGIFESLTDLKHRITMIQKHPRRTVPALVAGVLLASLVTLLVLQPTRASGSEESMKAEAVAAMEKWLAGIDAGEYAASWKTASKLFKDSVTEDQWVGAMKSVRGPLGAVESRKLVSTLYQTEVPRPPAEPLKGKFVIAQFQSSFENLAAGIETVSFEREQDGQWRASGYFIAPGS